MLEDGKSYIAQGYYSHNCRKVCYIIKIRELVGDDDNEIVVIINNEACNSPGLVAT